MWHHENADRLYCEEIDVGEGEPRAIASGLREHHTLEDMQGRLVLVVCNLRPAKLAGFMSNGMVLAAKGSDGKVKVCFSRETENVITVLSLQLSGRFVVTGFFPSSPQVLVLIFSVKRVQHSLNSLVCSLWRFRRQV